MVKKNKKKNKKKIKDLKKINKKLSSIGRFNRSVKGYFTWTLVGFILIPIYLLGLIFMVLDSYVLMMVFYFIAGLFGMVIIIMQVIYMVRIVKGY